MKHIIYDDLYLDTMKSKSFLATDSSGKIILGAETDPIVGAINGIVKANGAGVISAATADVDYQVPLTFGDGLIRTANDIDVDFNTTNLKITSDQLNTIQDIATSASPQFANLVITSGGKIRPSANSTIALAIAQADGTSFITFDTTGKHLILGVASSLLSGHTAVLGRLGQTIETTVASTYGGIALNSFTATAWECPIIDFNRSRHTTKGSHTVVQSGDNLGYIIFRGSNGSAFLSSAWILASADAAWGAADAPGRLGFYTVPDGSTTGVEAVRINSAQNVGIGTTAQSTRLHVKGTGTTYGTNLTNTLLHLEDSTAMGINNGAAIVLSGIYTGTSIAAYGGIKGGKENATDNNYASYLTFYTRANGGNLTEQFRISSAGDVNINNNVSYCAKDSGGTIRTLLLWDSSNVVHLRNNALGTGGSIAIEPVAGGVAAVTISNAALFTFYDTANLAFGSSTGTKIGTATTQKIGFFNATPIVQPLATTDLGTVLSNLGLRAAGTAYPITTSGAVQFTGGVTITTTNLTLTDKDIVLGTTTGTKIGTATSQLLGFYGATPVDQPATVSDSATQDLTGADTVDRAKTEADLTSCKNAINAIIDRLQELGLIA